MSLSQLQQQQRIADEAYRSGNFPKGNYATQKEAYDAFTANQAKLIAAAKAKQVQQNPTPMTEQQGTNRTAAPAKEQTISQPTASAPTPLPAKYWDRQQIHAEIAARTDNPNIKSQLPSGAVITAYNRDTKQVSYRTAEQEKAWQESVSFYTKAGYAQFGGKYAPVNVPVGYDVASITEGAAGLEVTLKPNGKPTALDQAKQLALIKEHAALRARQGTAVTGLTTEQIISRLSDADKEAFKVWQSERVTNTMVDMGTFFAAGIAIPIIGPTAAIQGAVIGAGVTQGMKTASVAWQGGDVGKSLLTPEETVEAIAGGIIFSGISKGVMSGIKSFAPTTVAESVSAQGLKGAFSRASVHAGLGGGVSFVVSGGDPQETAKGAAFGALFSLGTEAVGAGVAKFNARYDVAPRVFGVKAKELTGLTEVEKQVLRGKEISIKRLTTLETRDTRLSYKEAKMYDELARYSRNPKVMLGGTEKVVRVGGDEFETFMRSTEANRSATAILEAAKGQSFKMGKVKIAQVDTMIGTPSRDVLGVEKVRVTTGYKGKGRNKVPAILAEKTIVPAKEIIVPKKQITYRDFTGVQLKVKVDPQVYAKFGKNLPQEYADAIYKALGGGFKQMMTRSGPAKDLTGPMKPLGGRIGSKEAKTIQVRSIQERIRNEINKTLKATTINTEAEVKEIVMPKAIIDIAKPATRTSGANAFTTVPKRIQAQIEEEETAALSYPKGRLPSPNIMQVPSVKVKDITQPLIKINQSPIITTKAKDTPSQAAKEIPVVSLKQSTINTPTINKVTTTAMFDVSFPKAPPSVPGFPSFGLGGGSGASVGGKLFSVKYGKRRHRLKTADEMLKTFGLGGTAKGLGNVEKTLKQFERESRKFAKGFNSKQPKRKVRRRKR